MQRDRQGVVVDAPELVEQQLALGARVDEHDGGAGREDPPHHRRRGREAHPSRPRHMRVGEHQLERGRRPARRLDHLARRARADIGRERRAVGDRRRQADPRRLGRDRREAREAERQLVAALGAGERVHLVDHHAPEPGEQRGAVLLAQQQHEALGGGEQDVGRTLPLALAAAGRRVAGARLDGDGEVHVADRRGEVARDVGRERLQRTHVDGVDPGRRVRRRRVRCRRIRCRRGERGERRQEARERLAAAGRRQQQHVLAPPRRLEHVELVRPRRPAPLGEPARERFGKCSGHAPEVTPRGAFCKRTAPGRASRDRRRAARLPGTPSRHHHPTP